MRLPTGGAGLVFKGKNRLLKSAPLGWGDARGGGINSVQQAVGTPDDHRPDRGGRRGRGNRGYGEAGGEIKDRNRGLKDFVQVFNNTFRNGNEFVVFGPRGGVPGSPRHFEA